MKKFLLVIPLLLMGFFVIASDGFPKFPMTLYGNIKIGDVDLPEGTLKIYDGNGEELKIYNSSEEELSGWPITTAGKYGSNKATEEHLLLNTFEGPLSFKVIYNGKTYDVNSDSIDDSNKGNESCPSKNAIMFDSLNCRYDITINEPTFSLIFNNSDIPTQKVIEGNSPQKPTDPERDGYRFDGWYTTQQYDEAFDFTQPITSETNIYAKWVQVFSITFVDEDKSTILKAATLYDYLTLATNIDKPTLSKSADEKCNTYVGSWTPEVANVTEDKIYTAQYQCTDVKKYTITFVDEDDKPIGNALSLEYDASVTAPTIPTKSSDNTCNIYEGSWSPEITNVTKDQEYKATYTCTDDKEYTITFVDENNQQVGDTLLLKYNASVLAPSVPTKQADNTCDTYAGSWTPEVSNVTKDQEYKATYTCSKVKQYNITFVDEDGTTVLKEATPYDYGTLATDIVKPTLSKSADERCNAYAGSWSPEVSIVTKDQEYKATYSCTDVKKYTIKFLDENNQQIGDTLSLEYEATVTAPSVPTKSADERCNAYAGSWSPEVSIVTKDQEYKATYSCTDVKKYTIKFLDENNQQVGDALSLEYEASVDAPDVPVKQGDNTCDTYAGNWSPEVTNVTKDQEYKATYSCSKVKQYNVTFIGEDGTTVLKEATPYDYGTLATNIVKPTLSKSADERCNTYAGSWSPEVTNVTEDATYTAHFECTSIKKYSITFVDENNQQVGDSLLLEYEATITAPTVPTKSADERCNTYAGSWSPEVTNVTKDQEYKATYSCTDVKKYTIKFLDENNQQVGDALSLEYEASVDAPDVPVKQGDNTCETYAGSWDPVVANVSKDQEYKAAYTCSKVKQYNITFVDEDGTTVLKEATSYDYGTLAANISKPSNPTKQATAQYTYSFAGWTPEIQNVTEDATYKATYSSTVNKYTLSFYDDDGTTLLDSQTVDYGENVTYGKGTPTKEKTAQYTYSFSNWYTDKQGGEIDNLENLIGNRNVYARYDSTVNEYDVTFTGAIIEKQTVEYGEKAIEPDPKPTKDGFKFDGWYRDENYSKAFNFSDAITGATVIYIKWNQVFDLPTGDDAPVLTGSINPNDVIGSIIADENIPATSEGKTDGKENVVNGSDVASDNSTANIQGGVEVYPTDDNGNKIDNATIIFKKPRLIKIPVLTTGKVKVKVRHYGGIFGFFGLTNYPEGVVCDDNGGIKEGTPYKGEELEIKYETDVFGIKRGYVYIYTCSASEFVAYTETKNQSTPTGSTGGGGGGGGGGSSYSCKNLPDNAVANNTSKPKSNTNYSYSTNTGDVCTFQCKSGYARNEKDSKCEKSDTKATTGDTTKLDESINNSEESENNGNSNDKSWYQDGDQSEVLSNGFSREFNNAYIFAYRNGITTMDDISKADMNGPLTRVAMAKMLSNYAINVLGKKPDTSKIPNFRDVDSKLDSDYNNGVTLAYQLGIMGIGINNFRPYDLVTRAEFGTALSRMLFGLSDGVDNYYSTHLAKLKAEGIINNDNPYLGELRGYVMLMLMRSAIK